MSDVILAAAPATPAASRRLALNVDRSGEFTHFQ